MAEDTNIDAVIAKVNKLLALAGDRSASENEAAVAAQKAQDLLEAYNLDMAIINQNTRTHVKREDVKLSGGLYKWQRNLWYATATLNFCKYAYYMGNRVNTEYQHQLIGSPANVIGTKVLAEYLEQTVERLARRWVRENRPGKSVFIREAIAYREGVANRLTNRLWTKRWENLRQEEERIKREREANLARGIDTRNALVLQDVINTEEDLNNDYLNGWEPGTSARYRVEREAKQRAAQAAADEELRRYSEWAKAHPEEAARREKEAAEKLARDWEAMNKNKRKKAETPEQKRAKLHSYREGWDKGSEVSIDRQVGNEVTRRIR